MDKQDLIRLVLVCALHGHDAALDAPWASGEGSTASLAILSCLADALGCANKGMTLTHSSHFILVRHWLVFQCSERCGIP